MKKNKVFLLGLLFPLTGCSCSSVGTFSWAPYKNNQMSMSLESSKFKNYKLSTFEINSQMTRLKQIINNKGSRSDFVKYYNNLDSDCMKILNCYVVASTKYYASGDSKMKEKSENYHKQYTDLSTYFMDLETDIYHSSNEIRQAYFGDMSDSDIEKRLERNVESIAEAEYDRTFNEYQTEASELYNQYKKDRNQAKYLDTGYDYFIRYINAANELVSQISFDNYLDYSYSYYYSRDYKIEDVFPFINYVKEYLVPIYKEKTKITMPSNVDSTLLDYLENYNFCNENTDMSEMLSSYADELGGNYLNCYNNEFKYGYYCFSDSNDSLSTAYEWGLPGKNEAILYFSSLYQDVLSVVHEFGHYYSCIANNGIRKNDAYDLQETYSQGNEYTFCNYLLETKKDDENYDTYCYFADQKFYKELKMIIQEAVITEVENFAYTTPGLTKETLISGVNNILAEYGETADPVYFMVACTASPCYYISYATSVIEAMQFRDMNFEDAKNNYKTLIESGSGLTMLQRWEQANLTSPFEEQTFIDLANRLNAIKNKYN